MINKDRIVPITKIDLITLYAMICKLTESYAAELVAADTAEGDFTISAAFTHYGLLNEPAKTVDIASTVSSAAFYFVPTLDYEGITVGGAAATLAGDTVVPDGASLYKATLSSGTVTIALVTPAALSAS